MLLILLKYILVFTNVEAFEHLEVQEVRESNASYERFCLRQPSECEISEDKVLEFSQKLLEKLEKVNVEVNENTPFVLDSDQYGEEERWGLPTRVGGDCEDNALLKRQILVDEYGLPRSALRMVTAFHKEMFYAHALLAVLTDNGAYILDQDEDVVYESRNANYIFESMELPERRWVRFFQEW